MRMCRYREAFRLLSRMKQQHLQPQTRSYNSALNACEKARRGEETLQLLDDMVETKVGRKNSPRFCLLLGSEALVKRSLRGVAYRFSYGFHMVL